MPTTGSPRARESSASRRRPPRLPACSHTGCPSPTEWRNPTPWSASSPATASRTRTRRWARHRPSPAARRSCQPSRRQSSSRRRMPPGSVGLAPVLEGESEGRMGLFKSMKDLSSLTKEAKQLQSQQQQEAGYKPGFGGQMQQMGDMISQAKDQLADLTDDSGERAGILANGIAGQGVIVAHGTPERGAQWFNLDIDLEVHVSGRQPYRVNNQY